VRRLAGKKQRIRACIVLEALDFTVLIGKPAMREVRNAFAIRASGELDNAAGAGDEEKARPRDRDAFEIAARSPVTERKRANGAAAGGIDLDDFGFLVPMGEEATLSGDARPEASRRARGRSTWVASPRPREYLSITPWPSAFPGIARIRHAPRTRAASASIRQGREYSGIIGSPACSSELLGPRGSRFRYTTTFHQRRRLSV
jgi:hypothetical protein